MWGGQCLPSLGMAPTRTPVPALPPAPLVPWTSPYASQGLSFHMWRRKHCPQRYHHTSLASVIGQAMGDTLPLMVSGLLVSSLLGVAEFGAGNELSALLGLSHLLLRGTSWHPAWCMKGIGAEPCKFGKGPQAPSDRGSAIRR